MWEVIRARNAFLKRCTQQPSRENEYLAIAGDYVELRQEAIEIRIFLELHDRVNVQRQHDSMPESLDQLVHGNIVDVGVQQPHLSVHFFDPLSRTRLGAIAGIRSCEFSW